MRRRKSEKRGRYNVHCVRAAPKKLHTHTKVKRSGRHTAASHHARRATDIKGNRCAGARPHQLPRPDPSKPSRSIFYNSTFPLSTHTHTSASAHAAAALLCLCGTGCLSPQMIISDIIKNLNFSFFFSIYFLDQIGHILYLT